MIEKTFLNSPHAIIAWGKILLTMIAEKNIKLALALGFIKTNDGWHDQNEVLFEVSDDNTFDAEDLIFHSDRHWFKKAFNYLVFDKQFFSPEMKETAKFKEIADWFMAQNVEKAFELLIDCIEENTAKAEENYEKSDWAETHFEIVAFMIQNEEKIASMVNGRGGMWMMAEDLTNWFQKKYANINWGDDLDWYDTLEELFDDVTRYKTFESWKKDVIDQD